MDNVQALAFQRWLVANGWAERDIFIDIAGIGAGERWRDALRKAGATCEVVVLLATPAALDSDECRREIDLAEDLGKPIIIAMLGGVAIGDSRLARYTERQIVDLEAEPRVAVESFDYAGTHHEITFADAALKVIKSSLERFGIAPGHFAWAPRRRDDGREPGPYPGLAAFGEGDAGVFFGREADIEDGLATLSRMRRQRTRRFLLIQAASGAGKSSFLRAGLWPRLKRDVDFAPLAIVRGAGGGVISGCNGLAVGLQPFFAGYRVSRVAGETTQALTRGEDGQAIAALGGLLAEATQLATAARRVGATDARPPATIIAVDQGEELLAAGDAAESTRFLKVLAGVMHDLPEDVDIYVVVTIRADSVDAFLQQYAKLDLGKPETMLLLPLPATAYRDVILKPAEVFTSRVRRLDVDRALADKLSREAKGADALPLLAATLERLFDQYSASGRLTTHHLDAIGGMEGAIDQALQEALRQAGPVGDEASLQRLIIPALATWDPAAGAAKRLSPREEELLAGSRAALKPLADAMVAQRLLIRGVGTVEVAHEALLRRAPIADWLDQQKDALKLRDDVLREAEEWEQGGKHAEGLVRRGSRLRTVVELIDKPEFAAALTSAEDYIQSCVKAERTARGRNLRILVLLALLFVSAFAELARLAYADLSTDQSLLLYAYNSVRLLPVFWDVSPRVMAAADEQRLMPQETLQECAECPELVVLPSGEFTMGSPDDEDRGNEHPQHKVVIKFPFAVAKYAVTFEQWDACVAHGGCSSDDYVKDNRWGSRMRPAVKVSWNDAKQYVTWLSKLTGKPYRLLSEAEFEYAARAGTTTSYPWGNEIGIGHASCNRCGSRWDAKQTAPVGSFAPNAFGLFDMHGNVWQWVEDAYVENYNDAPTDGSFVSRDITTAHTIRGGAWDWDAEYLRSSSRLWHLPGDRYDYLGFRVARTLLPPYSHASRHHQD